MPAAPPNWRSDRGSRSSCRAGCDAGSTTPARAGGTPAVDVTWGAGSVDDVGVGLAGGVDDEPTAAAGRQALGVVCWEGGLCCRRGGVVERPMAAASGKSGPPATPVALMLAST